MNIEHARLLDDIRDAVTRLDNQIAAAELQRPPAGPHADAAAKILASLRVQRAEAIGRYRDAGGGPLRSEFDHGHAGDIAYASAAARHQAALTAAA